MASLFEMRLLLGAVALVVAGWANATGVFLPVSSEVAKAEATALEARTPGLHPVDQTWQRRVRVDRNELDRARGEVEYAGAGHLSLNVRAGVELDVQVERSAETAWGYSLSGRIGEGLGFVTLVVHDEAIAGSIWTPHASYEITHLGHGVHTLRDATNKRFECGGASGVAVPDSTAPSNTGDPSVADVSVVDILALWNPNYSGVDIYKESYEQKKIRMRATIDLAVTFTNDALERSGAFVSLNLVGAVPVEYPQISLRNTQNMLVDPSDGYMDDVHVLRDAVGADLVYLFTNTFSLYGGLAGEFSVGAAGAFPHEIGHAMGLLHERYDTPGRGQNHGFILHSDRRLCYMTIMAAGSGCFGERTRVRASWVPFYASPWRYLPADGSPLGVSNLSNERGVDGPANAVLALNRNRRSVANIRPSRAYDGKGRIHE